MFDIISTTFPISEKKVFGLRGGSIVLQAEQVTRVISIIWKHNKDKAAEWFEGDDAPTYYNIFTSVTTLDTQTWALTISNLQTHFSGKYSAEVNNKDPTQFVTLTVLGPVSKPAITMDCINDSNCTLTCKGKKDGLTTYTWANGIEKWPGPELTVERIDHDVVYTCNFSNPVSWASSQGTVKKYLPPPPDPGQKK
ncbi:SLAM family member 5-like isoform X1 [Clupea harengus]|uniref:SLAM family member 5-like isoform X1 n=1 Tax=Clupea harengus TaxID=7950 RepID=A0A6P8GGJ3_CLUHA|nr:SLAM family member 5-like isoform X1 [Clupea harengus]